MLKVQNKTKLIWIFSRDFKPISIGVKVLIQIIVISRLVIIVSLSFNLSYLNLLFQNKYFNFRFWFMINLQLFKLLVWLLADFSPKISKYWVWVPGLDPKQNPKPKSIQNLIFIIWYRNQQTFKIFDAQKVWVYLFLTFLKI